MRLFKYAAVIAVATAGRKYETNEDERACISDCKDRLECHGQDNTDGPTECIQECRDECTAERRNAIKKHLSPRTQQKAVIRRAQAKQRRMQHRQSEKAINPAPMIKDFHQLYEDGEVPRRFIACLKNERENQECEGHGQDMWGCKREMVSNCLDRNEDFEGLGSEKLVELVSKFREGLTLMRRKGMEMDVTAKPATAEPTSNPHAIVGVDPNNKNKVKVNSIKKALDKKKDGKVNYFADGVPADLVDDTPPSEPDTPATQDIVYEYEDEEEGESEEGESAENVEEEEEEEDEDYNPEETEPEDAPLAPQVQNDWSDLNQIVAWEEPVEPEDKKKHREAVKKPMALYSYVGNGGSHKVQGGKNNKAQLAKKEPHTKLPHVKRISKDQFINEMCRCRTSMEHYRVKNYLARNGAKDLSNWEHHDETCKWCAFPNSKKCWQCQVHWKKASEGDSDAQVRNEQVEMACFLYVRSVKNGKFKPMHTKGNDPCPMRNLHHGKFNPWQSEGKFGSYFAEYKELHRLNHQAAKKKNSNKE